MKTVCSYCRGVICDGEAEADDVSHGICDACARYFRRQWRGLTLQEYLERFDAPVVVIDQRARFVTCNARVVSLLGIDTERVRGFLGGDALECAYARLPEGCGRTVHCKTCAIRNTVTHTLRTRESVTGEPAILHHRGGDIAMEISTRYVDGVVLVKIERVIEE